MEAQDWARSFVITVLAAFLLFRVHVSLDRLLKDRIGSSEMSVDADEIKLPSITFCLEKLGGNTTKSENITADYNKLPKMEDMLAAVIQRVTIENE